MLDSAYHPPPDATAINLSYEQVFEVELQDYFATANERRDLELGRAGAVYTTASEDLDGFLTTDMTIFFGCLCTREEALIAALQANCLPAIDLAIARTDDTVGIDLFDAYPDERATLSEVRRALGEAIETAKTRATKVTGLHP